MMMDGRTLKECLQESTEDLQAIVKMIVAFVLDGDRSCGSLTSLSESFRRKYAELTELLLKVPEHQRREQEIRRLQAEVDARDRIIGNLQKKMMNAEGIITQLVFDTGQKLKDVRQAEANRVNSETIIRFANQISRSHSVAAPLGWQLGDPSRPYPTEAEFRASALAAPRVTAQTAPPALSLLRQPTASTSGMLRATGRGASPMTPYSAAMQQQQRSWSPRGAFVQHASSSPRGRSAATRGGIISPRMSAAPGASLLQRRPSLTGSSPHLSSPSSSYPSTSKAGLPPPVKNVEQMSSDSSSSSSSDEGEDIKASAVVSSLYDNTEAARPVPVLQKVDEVKAEVSGFVVSSWYRKVSASSSESDEL